MADHLAEFNPNETMDSNALNDAAETFASSQSTVILAAATAPEPRPGETRGQYATRLRNATASGAS